MVEHINNLTEDKIVERLTKAQNASITNPYPPGLLADPLRPAAVLIPLLCKENNWHVLLIRRTTNQYDPHSGQVAFPGGASDPTDSTPEATALREAREEIGLNPKNVIILGRLNDFLTITSYRVTPIIARIPWPYTVIPAQNEVSRVFTIPLAWLADPANYEIKDRGLPPPYDPIQVVYYKPYHGEVLWGASARFTMGLLDILFSGDS